MFLTLLLGLTTAACASAPALVFMRESAAEKQVMLLQDGVETALTSGREWHLYPDISSDGDRVVWVEGPSERNLRVTLLDRRSGERSQWITPRAGMALQPRFSRNGRLIYVSVPTAEGNRVAKLEPAQRGKQTGLDANGTRLYAWAPQLIAVEGQTYFPRPSADGSFVVLQRNFAGRKEIVEHDVAAGTTKVLAAGMAPALSFDENLVAYTSKEAGSWDVWLYDRRTGQKTRLTSDAGDEMAPAFTPDNGVAFASNRNGRFQLYQLESGTWRALVTTPESDYAPNFSGETRWHSELLPSLPGEPRSSFGAVAHQGKMYVCGGHAGAEHTYPPESFRDDLFVFDPATGTWSTLAPRPHKAHGFELVAHGDYLYAFGGFAYGHGNRPAWKSLDVVDRYDLRTNQWTTVARLPRARSSNVASVVDGKVFLIGGWDATPSAPGDAEGDFHHEVDVFDLATEAVSTASWQIPLPLRRAFSAIEHDGHIILVGGLGVGSSHFELLAQVTRINPWNGLTRELSALPFPTFAPAVGVLDNELLVFGGMFRTGPMDFEYVSHAYAMPIGGGVWRHTGRSLLETKGFSRVVPWRDGVVVLGGHSYEGGRDTPVATVEYWTKGR